MGPDHLALLPNSVGACSWQDGCGIPRVNQGTPAWIEKVRALATNNTQALMASLGFALAINEASHDDIRQSLQTFVDRWDSTTVDPEFSVFHMVREVFEDSFVFSKHSPAGMTLWLMDYTSDEDGRVSIDESIAPVEVMEKTEFVPVARTNKTEEIMKDNKTCCPEKVKALIANEASPFKAEDEAVLLSMSTEQITALEGKFESVKVNLEDGTVTVNKDGVDSVEVKPEGSDVDAFLKAAPEGMRGMLQNMYNKEQGRRTELIKVLSEQEGAVFSADELQGMDTPMLEKMAGLATANTSQAVETVTNFGMAGSGSITPSTTKEAPYVRPTLNFKKEG
jgi:copper chaperone CopZ